MNQADDKFYKKRNIILFNIALMTFMGTLDGSIVNVALPTMAKKLYISTEAISWVVSIYLLVIAGTILVFGRLGDIIGKTKIFNFGIIIFTMGSLICGIAGSFPFLLFARVVQAIGAAGTMSASQGIITQVFPPQERGRALGINGTFVALGSLAGPPIGGFIVGSLEWNYIFLINVPIGIIVYLLSFRLLPKSTENSDEKLDVKGALLFAIAIVSLFGSLLIGEDYGYRHPYIIGGFILFVLSFVTFIIVENRTEAPLLQLKLFQNKLFSLSIFCGFISFIAINSLTIIQPFYLQNTLKFSPSFTGLIMMVFPVVLAVVAPLSGALSDKIGSEILTFIGLSINSVGLILMSTLTEHTSLYTMIIYIVIMSIGNGLFQSPNNSLILSNAPKNMLGIVGSVNALVRNLGMITGIAMAILILYGRMSNIIGYDVSTYIEGRDDAFIYGMKGAYMTAASVCAVGAILTAIRLSKRKSNIS
ncbi:EmrB/QacA subfamily drug resistance transporter [Kineothrix alysoides]|uniref:EmrB/QacA subfamily drug resistance transporter n=1 Tax=Kineothrix alysoides TaxID=1469948 RepID=A0A4R1R3K3_9FIRM|nr:MFS transporter [Kineothrix alysoides]TCL60026.1 EmrB/QacA subfamily drug resistance transporter [Kineothrix alysoides]